MPDIWDYFGKLHDTLTTCSVWPSFQQQILLQTQMLDSKTKNSFSLWLMYTLQVKTKFRLKFFNLGWFSFSFFS